MQNEISEIRLLTEYLQTMDGMDVFYLSEYCDVSDIYDNTQNDNSELIMQEARSPEQLSNDNKQLALILFLVTISVTCSSIVAGTIAFHKKMRVHPNGLIAFLAVANIGSCISAGVYSLGTPKFACYMGMAQLFKITMYPITWFYQLSDPQYDFNLMDSVKTLTEWNIQYF